MTRAVPITIVVVAAAAVGWYEAGAGSRDEHHVVLSYVTAWTHEDYQQMYALLDPASQKRTSAAKFTADLKHVAGVATLSELKPSRILSIHNEMARISFIVHTNVYGTLHETLDMPLSGSGGGARVQFGSSLLFPGLGVGQKLRRKALLGARGTLLANNGQVLANGSSLSTSISPSVAAEIVGTLGKIPAADASQYAAQGYPKNAQVGQDGLEQIFQTKLAGKPGGQLLAGKRVLATSAPTIGATVKTTINPDLEQDAMNAIANHYAGITVLNPQNGDIEAAAGLAFTALQPPGSTFKIITASAALQAGLTTPTTVYPELSSVRIDGFKMQNAAGEICGGTLTSAFANSCDTTFAPLGVKVGATRLVNMAERFGFNQPTGIASALTSTIPSASAIGGPTAVAASAIGQGLVQATTLEMADVGATIADKGRRPIPKMSENGKTRWVQATSSKVAGEVQDMMEAVVEYGTGTAAQIPGVTVAGKTGTAELSSTAGKTNDAKATDAWFVAYAPAQDPKVVVCALFPNDGYGADSAAPTVKTVLEEALGIS